MKITVWQTRDCLAVYHGEWRCIVAAQCAVWWPRGGWEGGRSKMVKCDDEEEICSTGHTGHWPSLLVHPRSSCLFIPLSPLPPILWTPPPGLWSQVRPLQKVFLSWYFCRVTSADQKSVVLGWRLVHHKIMPHEATYPVLLYIPVFSKRIFYEQGIHVFVLSFCVITVIAT